MSSLVGILRFLEAYMLNEISSSGSGEMWLLISDCRLWLLVSYIEDGLSVTSNLEILAVACQDILSAIG